MNQHARIQAPPPGEGGTPVMLQYLGLKADHPDSLLFYRMGDFYELFFGDAEVAASALGIALTRRGKHAGADIPMCGVPVVRADEYLNKLVRSGHRVAVCEQVEDPAEARKRGAKAVVRREVVRLVTPGTLTEDALLDPGAACLLAGLARLPGGACAVAAADLSTGAFVSVACPVHEAEAVLARLDPREVVVPDALRADPALASALEGGRFALAAPVRAPADPSSAERRLREHYGVDGLDGFGGFAPVEIVALDLVLSYLLRTQVAALPRLAPPRREDADARLRIDPATRAGLELTRSAAGGRDGSLLDAVDATLTPAGARLLCERISGPSRDLAEIGLRHDAVGWLAADPAARGAIRAALRGVPDLHRALSRLALGRGGPRDLSALCAGVAAAAALAGPAGAGHGEVRERADALRDAPAALAASVRDLLVDDPPAHRRDGGFVRDGADPDLDEARRLSGDARQVIAGLQAAYAERAACRTLRIKHTGQLGYFVEVPLAAGEILRRAPDGFFVPRQTMTDAMRFTTAELGELEGRIAGAGERAAAIEAALFDRARDDLLAAAPAIEAAAAALAAIDVCAALAEVAAAGGWSRPEMTDGLDFEVTGGRHPVVEAALRARGEPFVPNDCRIGGPGAGFIRIVTGPNMGGKSTYLRQNALMAVLAQAGSFVPAESARIGAVDRLYSRVGASDDLARGRSTFMVEMVEAAAILNQATPRSLVVLDEIGRGTSTHDGLSIAWACVERLHGTNRCRALFATHYHELAALGDALPGAGNLTVRVAERDGEAVFLHEVVPGAADRSYGLHVARRAGMPADVVARAEAVLAGLEAGVPPGTGGRPEGGRRDGGRKPRRAEPAPLPLFDRPPPDPLREAVASLDPDGLTPRQALDALYRLRSLATAPAP